ncbi:MAG: ATP-dependent DNA helicase [Ktedonobacteraceae bacterium]
MDTSHLSPLGRRVVADLRQGGILSQQLPGYQERPAQIEMAMAVSEALDTGQHALIEAPTGVGKSLAYLVALVRSGKVAIISTSNKALQDQLFYKDIPFVRQYVQPVDASLYKGVNNYLCLERLKTTLTEMTDIQRQEWQDISETIQNLPFTFTGDFDQLPHQVSPELRSRINGDSDQCAWNKCRYFHDCYIRQRYEQAQHAQIIVVNHTLLLLDVAFGGAILPEREVIVLDEAHHLEEEATRVCATTVRYTQITSLLADKRLRTHSPLKLQEEVFLHAGKTWQHLEQQMSATGASTISLKQPLLEALVLADTLTALSEALQDHPPGQQSEQEETLYNKLIQRTQRLADHVRTVFRVDQQGSYVYVLERGSMTGHHTPSIEAKASLVDVAPWLKERLFEKWPVICVSATLSTIYLARRKSTRPGPTLAYYKKRIGLEKTNTIEGILPLPFNYRRNSLLYVPSDLPEPPAPNNQEATWDYIQRIAQRIHRLITISQGRAFLLFTNTTTLHRVYQVYQTLTPHLPYPLLRQGDMPRAELVHRFIT